METNRPLGRSAPAVAHGARLFPTCIFRAVGILRRWDDRAGTCALTSLPSPPRPFCFDVCASEVKLPLALTKACRYRSSGPFPILSPFSVLVCPLCVSLCPVTRLTSTIPYHSSNTRLARIPPPQPQLCHVLLDSKLAAPATLRTLRCDRFTSFVYHNPAAATRPPAASTDNLLSSSVSPPRHRDLKVLRCTRRAQLLARRASQADQPQP